MNKFFMILLIVFSLIFALIGCGTDNGELNEEPNVFAESNQVDNFDVKLEIIEKEQELTVAATITYVGEKDEIDIYHGGSIFYFNIYQKDGNFEYLGSMDAPLLTTTLTRNEPHKVDFTDSVLDELEPGTYEFEAIAVFSLNVENIVDSLINNPVSLMIIVE